MKKLILLLIIALYSCHSDKVSDEFLGRWKRINPKSTHHKTLDVNNEYLTISDNDGNVMIQKTFDSMIEEKESPFFYTAIYFKESKTLTLTDPQGPPFPPPGIRMAIDKKTGILNANFLGRYIKIK
jgi:hypothetical protein